MKIIISYNTHTHTQKHTQKLSTYIEIFIHEMSHAVHTTTIYRKYQDNKNARYYFIAARLKWLLLLEMVTVMLLLLFVAGEYFAQRLLVFPMRNMWVYRQSYLVSSSGFLHNPKLSKSHIRARSSPNRTLSVLSGIGNLNWEEKIIKKDRREREI